MIDKILYKTEYLSLVERDGWYFFAQIPGSAGGVTILLYRLDDSTSVLGRYETCPAHGDTAPALTAIAGGIEVGDTPLQTAIKEAYEEAGYHLKETDFLPLGACRLSTNQDTMIYLFAANVTGKPRVAAPGDGTRGERDAYCAWVTPLQAIQSKSAFMSALMLRLLVEANVRLF